MLPKDTLGDQNIISDGTLTQSEKDSLRDMDVADLCEKTKEELQSLQDFIMGDVNTHINDTFKWENSEHLRQRSDDCMDILQSPQLSHIVDISVVDTCRDLTDVVPKYMLLILELTNVINTLQGSSDICDPIHLIDAGSDDDLALTLTDFVAIKKAVSTNYHYDGTIDYRLGHHLFTQLHNLQPTIPLPESSFVPQATE